MKVICSGMSKTGTKSLAEALRILGYNVYDFEEQYFYLEKEFMRLCEKGWTTEDIRKLYDGVDAVTDLPGNVLWEEILTAYPDAKIIHTERNSEEEWGKSLEQQIQSIRKTQFARIIGVVTPSGSKLRKFFYQCHALLVFGKAMGRIIPYPTMNKQLALLRYRQHNSHVKATVPKDQLLILKLSDGWEPMCKFLGKPIPEQKFPHKNKGASITDEMVETSYVFDPIKKEFLVFLTLVIVVLGFFLYYVVY